MALFEIKDPYVRGFTGRLGLPQKPGKLDELRFLERMLLSPFSYSAGNILHNLAENMRPEQYPDFSRLLGTLKGAAVQGSAFPAEIAFFTRTLSEKMLDEVWLNGRRDYLPLVQLGIETLEAASRLRSETAAAEVYVVAKKAHGIDTPSFEKAEALLENIATQPDKNDPGFFGACTATVLLHELAKETGTGAPEKWRGLRVEGFRTTPQAGEPEPILWPNHVAEELYFYSRDRFQTFADAAKLWNGLYDACRKKGGAVDAELNALTRWIFKAAEKNIPFAGRAAALIVPEVLEMEKLLDPTIITTANRFISHSPIAPPEGMFARIEAAIAKEADGKGASLPTSVPSVLLKKPAPG